MTEPLSGAITGRDILDLTGLQSPDELAQITEIRGVDIVAVPESLAAALNRIPMHGVDLVVPIPDGVRPKCHIGMTTLGGGAISRPTAAKEFIIAIGVLIFTTPITEPRIAGIAAVGLVAAPAGSESALGSVLAQSVGAVHYYPHADGQQIKALAGSSKLGGKALANESGSPDDVLVAAGQLMITDPVQKLGFRQIFVAGQAILPRESRDVIEPALQVQGQIVWYGGENPRLILGTETYGAEFFDLVEHPLALVVLGELCIAPDVSADLLREKISEITLIGQIVAPRHTIPVLQYRTTEKVGEIKAVEDESE